MLRGGVDAATLVAALGAGICTLLYMCLFQLLLLSASGFRLGPLLSFLDYSDLF